MIPGIRSRRCSNSEYSTDREFTVHVVLRTTTAALDSIKFIFIPKQPPVTRELMTEEMPDVDGPSSQPIGFSCPE